MVQLSQNAWKTVLFDDCPLVDIPPSDNALSTPDRAGPIENAMEYADADYNCDAYMCRGYQLEDNLDNVQVFGAGDELAVHIDLIAGHRPGYAVS